MNKSAPNNTLQATKLAPPPKNLPIYGKDKPQFVNYVAWSNYAAALEQKRFLFGVRRRDLRRGTLVIGRPGMGKTKLLQTLIRQDIAHDHGLLVMDFQGALSEEVLKDIPEDRLNDVVYLDPHNKEGRLAMNPLGPIPAEYVHPFASTLVGTYKQLFPNSWSPALEYLLHNTFLAVLHHPAGTMRMAYDLLTDDDYRTEIAAELDQHDVGAFFSDTFSEWRDRHETSAVLPLINMLRSCVFHPDLKDMLDTPADHVGLDQIIKDKRIVIFRLKPEEIGDTNATVLATLYLSHLFLTMQQRGGRSIEQIQEDFPIYIDEHPHITDSFAATFAQSSGDRGLPLVISTRGFLGEDPASMQKLLALTDNIFCFRLFADDAYVLKNEMLPAFDTRDLQNLGKREMYCRLVIDGELSVPFSAEALEVLPTPGALPKSAVINASSNEYGIPKEGVY